MDTGLELTGVASLCPDSLISQDINAIFPTANPRKVAKVNCGQIFYDDSKGKETLAIERAFAFFQKTLEQNEAGQLLDPAGDDTTEDKIVHLFTAIFAEIGFPLPEIDPEVLENGEYAIGELVPDGPPVITQSKHAGIDDGGGLTGPVRVFIVQIFADEGELSLSSESHPCPAGVDNSFDCYPLFFDYSVSPESNVDPEIGLQLGQCNVSPEGVEVELLTPEGFLEVDDAPNGVLCEDVGPPVITMTGWRSYAWTVLEPISPLLRVAPLFAGQNPVGGRISNFSPVAPADPESGAAETTTELTPESGGGFSGDVQLFEAGVTDVENETGVSEGTVRFTVTNGDNVNEVFEDDVVEGSAFVDVGCNTVEPYADIFVSDGEYTVSAEYLGTSNFAPSSEPTPSSFSCTGID